MRSEGNAPPPQQTDESRAREAREQKLAARPPADAGQAERFRELLKQRQEPAAEPARGATVAAAAAADPLQPLRSKPLKLDETTPADTAALLQAQRVAFDPVAAGVAAPAEGSARASFAELLERHVRRLLVGEGANERGRDGQVMLRLSDESLPGADLFLARTSQGWTLRAETDRLDTLETIRRHAPALVERFAERALGSLEIDAELRHRPGS